VLLPIAAVAAVSVVLVSFVWRQGRHDQLPPNAARCWLWADMKGQRLRLLSSQLGLVGYFKIVLSFYQVVAAVPTVYDTELPKEYTAWIPTWLNMDIFQLILPGSCVGSFETRLLLHALVPLGVILGILLLATTAAAFEATYGPEKQAQRGAYRLALSKGLVRSLPLLILLAYLLLPSVASSIFASFNCVGLSEVHDRAFLVSDLSIECGTAEHQKVVLTSVLLIILWPVGAPHPDHFKINDSLSLSR
jgi:hypothetical protein